MDVFSLPFLFFFLPVTGLVFCLVPRRFRVFVLFVASAFFYAMTSPVGLGIMAVSVGIDFLLARPIFLCGKGSRWGKAAVTVGAAKNILLFVTLSSISQLDLMEMPLGVTVYCFTSLGYLVDLYNGETDPITSFYDYGLFCCFFGKLYVGPIISANQFRGQLGTLRPSLSLMGQGFIWLCHGLAKKVILADGVLALGTQFKDIPYQEKTVFGVWLLVICHLLATYYTLSGFSDMARGVGALFGMELPENFHYPLQADSVTDFFSRFNISANRFVRKYVYGALSAEDNGKLSTTLNILLITILMGLWYGININYLAWGGVLGFFIVLETLYGEKVLHRLPSLVRWLYTFVAVVFSFAIYSSGSISQAMFYLKTMVGLGTSRLWDNQALYLLTSNWLLLVLCVVFCSGFISRQGKRLQARWLLVSQITSLAVNLCLFVAVLAFL